MNIQNSKLKFFSIISGNDDEYQPIKNNFEKHLNIIGLENEHELIVTNTNSGSWEERDFLDTVYHKLDITLNYLKKGYYVFCSDLDIIFLKNPLPYLIDLMISNNYDILFQHDYAEEDDGKIYSVYCTGFFLVKPSRMAIKLFDRKVNIFKRNNQINLPKGDRSDQKYINRKLIQKRFSKLRVESLERALFPNGWYWMKYNQDIDPYIVHYNCIPGGIKGKEKEMKKYSHWLV